MALAASRTLLALFVTFCAAHLGRTAEKPQRPQNGKPPAVDRTARERWEPSIVLDGRPVDRFVISSSKPVRSHRFTKVGKDSRSPLLEDVDPDWVNLDGFAVLGGAAVTNTTAGSVRPPQTRNHSPALRAASVDRTTHRSSATASSRTQRRAPQSSSGPRQPERLWARMPQVERRQQHHTKPQSDQRNRHKLTSESVHVVSLQAQKAQGQSAPAHRATKTTTPEPPEYEARDISVRVMSPQSVLISWVDPAVEMGKVAPGASRSYTVRYREKGESARWEYKDSPQRRLMIDTLSADSMYEFSVRISQEENPGKWSVSVFQRTPESAPSGPPENFEVKPLRGKGTAAVATWDPPEEPNGRIKEYILSYAPAMQPFGMKSVTYRGSTTTATVEGLTPGDRYIFKIRATNRRGMGPQSKAFSVAMPGSSSAASSFSKTKDRPRISHTPSKQDTDHEESSFETTSVPEKPTTTTPRPAASNNRRTRPLSQTRSYHSIFSSVRGSVRNGVNRGSTRGRSRDDEDEEEEVPTTPAPAETTTEVVPETEEPDNDVSPEDVAVSATETPSLKVLTPSPTKPRPSPPNRRPVKIRVHQKASSKATSSFLPSTGSSSSSSALATSSSSSDPSSSSNPSSSSPSSSSNPSRAQESAASRKDYVASAYPETKNMYDTISAPHAKPSTPVVKETNSQQTDTTSAGRGRNGGSSVPSRPGYGRRHSGSLLRGNSTRVPNGYRPAGTSQSNSQSRIQSQATANSAPTSHNTHNSETSVEQDTSYREENDDTNPKIPNADVTKVEEPTSSSSTRPTEKVEERKNEGMNGKPTVPHTRISPSFAERFPWLASRYPSRTGAGARTTSPRQDGRTPWNRVSSSVGAGRPVLRGTPSRASGASGASSIQETSEDLRTPSTQDSLKSRTGESSVKPTTSSSQSSSADSQHSSGGSRDTAEPTHRGTSNEGNDRNEDYPDERNGGNGGRFNKVEDPTADQKHPSVTSGEPRRNTEDNDSVGARETPSRTRPSGFVPTHRRPGVPMNGRVRSPLLGNRQFGGSRLPMRPQPAQNTRPDASTSDSSRSSSDSSPSSSLPQPVLTSDRVAESGTSVTRTGGLAGGNSQSTSTGTSSSSSRDSFRNNGMRPRYPIARGKPVNGKNGRPNLTATGDKDPPSSQGTSKAVGQRFITGPDGTKWVVDLELGVLMNPDGQVLQDSQGKPKRVVLGEDGRTIFDHMGSPLVNPEGMALFGHGRDSQPVVNPKEKVLMIGGKPVVGLNPPRSRTFIRTTTTTTTTTTTKAPTTTPEPTTIEWTSEELTTPLPFPTCPPGTFSKTDEDGYPVVDHEGILDCYPEEDSSGMEMDLMVAVTMLPDALALEKDELFVQTTLPPPPPPTTTTTEEPLPEQRANPSNRGPSSEFDLSGKKRFTAPYVNYIQKDPGAPCSLTEALEYLQVDVLENLIEKDSTVVSPNQTPKHKPHNLTVVAMEGCHSFIILDWAQPMKDDMVSGYLVHSASYDDVLNNRWSSQSSSGTHLAVENLKPNSRYYFKVQAKNVFGLGPVSETLTYVTESDDPLLIERPPGGEPIWIPFTFKYNSAHSSCKGSQYVKRTWYRKFVGVVLCNSLRYKIFMGDGLREPFYSIGDTVGQGEDHCQFVDSYRDGRTGPEYLSNYLPSAQGYYRAYRQEPVSFGVIGRRTTHSFVGWYECGVPIPGKW